MTHLYPNNCFFAHLSLYYLALAFIKPKSVILDAGCGAGYGSAFLADRTEECKVYGVELDEKAIDFCRENFVAPNLEYLQMDLENISGFKDNLFDFVISSNVLEHIEHVDLFLSRICDLLKPNGKLLIIVPCIATNEEKKLNERIWQHLNIWSPKQWHFVLTKYFNKVRSFVHQPKPGVDVTQFNNNPEDHTFNETDFIFKEVESEVIGTSEPTLSAVFLAQEPLELAQRNKLGCYIEFVDSSYSRPKPIVAQYNSNSHVGEIIDGVIVKQSFTIDKPFCQIDIMFATFMRNNTKGVKISLLDDIGNEIRKITIEASTILDNEWVRFNFENIEVDVPCKFFIVIESPGASCGNAFTVRCSDRKMLKGETLTVNGKEIESDLTFRVFAFKNSL